MILNVIKSLLRIGLIVLISRFFIFLVVFDLFIEFFFLMRLHECMLLFVRMMMIIIIKLIIITSI